MWWQVMWSPLSKEVPGFSMAAPKNKQSYLERISFDPKLMVGWIAGYISNIRIVTLLTLSIIFLGLFSYFNLPQRLNPEIKIPIVIVSTVLPGAGPEDVEKLVTVPLEDKLRGLSGLDTITSISQENVSVISMQFANSVAQEKARADVKDAVDTVSTLPEDATDPNVNALDFENEPVWQFALTGDADIVSQSTFAKRLKETIQDIPNVDNVTIRGLEQQIIAIDVMPTSLAQYNMTPMQLMGALRAGLAAFPAGSVDTTRNTFSLTIDPHLTSVEDIRNMRVSVSGQTVRLGDIASISERSSSNQPGSFIGSHEKPAKPSITFAVYKRTNADIIKTATQVREVVDREIEKTEGRFTLTNISNSGELIKTQFLDLLGEFRSTIILVFITLFLFLGLRQAIISSITVPLTFLSAFIFMNAVGMSINFLSLFAFLLSLGLLIDDTIVVVSAMTAYYKANRFTPLQTGLLVWRDTIVPIWSTTLTTIWSFVPLLLSTGIIGEFIKPIPVVVTITMVSSTAISVLITLPIMILLLKPSIPRRVKTLGAIVAVLAFVGGLFALFGSNPLVVPLVILGVLLGILIWRQRLSIAQKISSLPFSKVMKKYSEHGVISVDGFALWYEKSITRVLSSKTSRRNVIIAIVSYAIFSFLLVPLGLVKTEFFPKEDTDLIYVNAEFPSGTTLGANTQASLALLEQFRSTEGIEFVVADIGTSFNGGSFTGGGDQTNTTRFTFHLPEEEHREIGSIAISQKLREQIKEYTQAKLSVLEMSGGPPAGADVQLKLSGDDLAVLDKVADQLLAHMQTRPGLVNREKSIKPGTSAIVFVPDLDRLNAAGLTVDAVGMWLRTYASGMKLDEVDFDDTTAEQTDVQFSFGPIRQTPESLGALSIPTPQGAVPLSGLGTFQIRSNPTLITREEGKRTISVSAGILAGYSAAEESKNLLDFANTIDLPVGYSWKTGGVNEENEKSVQSIMLAMLVAFLLILVTMVIQFQSFRQAVIVLLVIPLAVSSVFLLFALTGTPLSFPALIGVLSLFGIVVTNSMFIVDKINLNRKEGMPFIKAIADAGASRMEPIVLTKLCTVFGLLPVTIADPLWRGLGGAIIYGLILASTIMLLFIPVVYYNWMGGSRERA
jgi:multidrug efflux pump subunit AcrB